MKLILNNFIEYNKYTIMCDDVDADDNGCNSDEIYDDDDDDACDPFSNKYDFTD